jgi:hypothetical protein
MMSREHLVTARKAHHCDSIVKACAGTIEPGQDYVRAVAFYNDDGIWQARGYPPSVLKICMRCATAYGRDAPTERRKRKRR